MAYMTEFFPERSYHSVEDPPEYTLKDVQQIRVSTKQGKTAVSQTMRRDAYVNALADSMRSDLNVLMIGETRYAEAAECAIDAAVTGHLVLTTTHATNAFAIITRFENFLRAAKFSDPLGALCDPNVLAGLVCQCLIAKLCPVCRKPLKTLSPEEHAKALPAFMVPAFIGVFGTDRPEGVYVRGDGCPKCYLGLHGQTVVAEVVVMDQRMLAMLRCGKMMDAYNYWKAQTGSISYVEHAVKLIREGILDPYIATIRMGVPLDFNPFFEGDAL
jgi:type II secretory ATPase GspE/PulE/Tfp pilus assembly ATPase PilB-like protein